MLGTIFAIVYLTVTGFFKSLWWLFLLLTNQWQHPEIKRLNKAIKQLPIRKNPYR